MFPIALLILALASRAASAQGCDSFHVYFNNVGASAAVDFCALDLARYGISPSNETVTGRTSCLPNSNYNSWQQGVWPYINSSGVAVAGGVPQAANLSLHLDTIRATIHYLIGPSFAAYGGNVVIDMEWWSPTLDSSAPAYRNLSVALVRAEHPLWNASSVEAEASRQFTAAALDFMEATLRTYAELMPHARIGYYGYPRNWYYPCAANHNSSQCGYDNPSFGPSARAANDALARIFAASSALYPSIYLPEHTNTSASFPHHQEFIASVTAEAARLRDAHTPSSPVLPFTWSFYHDGHTILLPSDMEIELALPTLHGADGVILWGAPVFYNETQQMLTYLNATLGPLANKTVSDVCACASQRCSGKGSCTPQGGCRCLPGFSGPSCAGQQFTAAAPVSIRVTLTDTDAIVSAPIPVDYVSLSVEIDDVPHYLGPASGISPGWVALMNLLRAGSGGVGPALRVGGDSSDYSLWWDPPPKPSLPVRQLYAITREDLASYAAAVPQWQGSLILGTSLFLENDTSWGVAHVAAIAREIGWAHVDAVEIGNEPEGFNGAEALRPRAWSFEDYEREVDAHVIALEAAGLPPQRVQGLVLGGHDEAFDAGWAGYVASRNASLRSVSRHHYSIEGCAAGVPPPTLWALLDNNASIGTREFLAPYAAAAAAAGVAFRVGEGNSVSCGGVRGVSDVFAAALWALDTLLEVAALNTTQYNAHGGPHNAYSPVHVTPPALAPTAMPVFYGLWAASVATANASTLLAADVSGAPPLVRVHCLRETAGALARRVVVVHKDANGTDAAVAVVAPPAACGPAARARLSRLSASNVADSRGVSFAGLTLDGVLDGRPVPGGPPDKELTCVDGIFAFTVWRGTAAILTIA